MNKRIKRNDNGCEDEQGTIRTSRRYQLRNNNTRTIKTSKGSLVEKQQ
jgi:hypothetical protein